MNLRMVGKYISYLLWAAAVFMLPSAAVGLIYASYRGMFALLASAALCALAALLLFLVCRKENTPIYARESFVVAGGGWVLISLFGALPFVFSGEIPNFIEALFETASGFTTTGASILTNVEALSPPILFWRSFTHWLGGIGVLAFILAVVRAQSGKGFTLHLLRAESPGPQVGKIMPKTQESVRMLFYIYGGLSLMNLIVLLAGGMPMFDALCTMFGTAGTGGFGIKNSSMASYSPFLQNTTTLFMALFGINFSLYHLIIRREWKAALRDEELRLYVGIMLGSSAIIAGVLVASNFGTPGYSLHHSIFTVSSIMTTTGFATTDFNLWPEITRSLILALMVFGAMAGSTGGGFKISRLLILIKSFKAGIHRMLHPRSVKTIQMNGKPLDAAVVQGTQFFLLVYCGIAIVSFVLISVDGLSLETNLAAVLSCFNNIGPALGVAGPSGNYSMYSPFSKVVLTLNMLLGRLEIFPILLLFNPYTWRRKA